MGTQSRQAAKEFGTLSLIHLCGLAALRDPFPMLKISHRNGGKYETVARCEEGYLCDVCGGDVEAITDSDLYLRYVIGAIDPGNVAHDP